MKDRHEMTWLQVKMRDRMFPKYRPLRRSGMMIMYRVRQSRKPRNDGCYAIAYQKAWRENLAEHLAYWKSR